LSRPKKSFGSGTNDRWVSALFQIGITIDLNAIVELQSRTQAVESRTKIRGGSWDLNGYCHKGEPGD
jgi:hypothetical protein